MRKVYWNSVEGPNRRGRPLGRWEDKVKEYVSERGMRGNGLEWARKECMDRETGFAGRQAGRQTDRQPCFVGRQRGRFC